MRAGLLAVLVAVFPARRGGTGAALAVVREGAALSDFLLLVGEALAGLVLLAEEVLRKGRTAALLAFFRHRLALDGLLLLEMLLAEVVSVDGGTLALLARLGLAFALARGCRGRGLVGMADAVAGAFGGVAFAAVSGEGDALALGRERRGGGEGQREHKQGAEHGLAFLFVVW